MKIENETVRRIYTVGLLGFGALVCLSQPPALATVTAEKGSIESVKGYEEFSDAGNVTSDGDSSAGGDHSPQALWWFLIPAAGAWLTTEMFTEKANAPGPIVENSCINHPSVNPEALEGFKGLDPEVLEDAATACVLIKALEQAYPEACFPHLREKYGCQN